MDARGPANRNRLLWVLGAAVALVAIIVGVLALTDDDGEVSTGDTTTSSTEGTTTTSEATTTTAPGGIVDPAPVVFPDPAHSQRFDDPVALVSTFAREYVGMSEPIVGDLMQGDSRSGEIEVRGFAEAMPTTVLVRQLEDDSWFVIGAVTESIQPAAPAPGAAVTSPIRLTGQAYAFEGTVLVSLRPDGAVEPVATGFVTGRGDGVLGDYEGELAFDPQPAATYATILYTSEGGENGEPMWFTVTRVELG